MAEESNMASTVAEAPASTNETPKIAGKYENTEAFHKGFRELNAKTKMLDIKDDEPLVGENGIFTNDAAAERFYKSMESRLGSKRPKEEPAAPLEIKPENEIPDDADINGILSKAGIDINEIRDEKLTDEQYAKLKAQGYPKKVVDQYINDRRTAHAIIQEKIRTDAVSTAGGEEKLNTLMDFAKTLPKEQIDSLNARLADPKLYKGALLEIQGAYTQQIGAGNSTSLISGSPSTGTAPIKTAAEYKEVMNKYLAGDKSAEVRIRATPIETIQSWI